MNLKVKKVVITILIIASIGFVWIPQVKAAGLVINFSESEVNVGDTVIVTVTGNDLTGTVNLSVDGDATLSQDTVSLKNGSASVNAKITGQGSVRITATAGDNMQNSKTGEAYTGATGGTITVDSSSTTTDSNDDTNTSSEEKSDNANLSNLGIRPNDFSGFSPSKLTYDVTVPDDVDSVEVYATAQDENAKISGIGDKTLENGKNAIEVVVTAEDGTVKTYTINVTRGESVGTTEDDSTQVLDGLSSLKINDLELNPSFKTDVYEYTVKYIGEGTSLDIQTIATDPSYSVEVLGNEELIEGENTITILVSDEGDNIATYQVTVNKSLVDEEAIAREQQEKQEQEQRQMLMIAGGIVIFIIILIIIIVIKRRKNKTYAEEFSGIPFAGINDEDNYQENNSNIFDSQNDVNSKEPEYQDYLKEDEENQNYNNIDRTEEDQKDNEDSEKTITKFEFDDSEEKMQKEKAKRDFLAGYDSDYIDEYEEEKPRRGRRKGKRFK